MSTTFTRGENPLKADKLNTAFSERIARSGDAMTGPLELAADPTLPFEAATKQYVDRFTAIGVPTGAYVGASPPGNELAPLWWNSTDGQLYVQYNDGSSIQWVVANSLVSTSDATQPIKNALDYGCVGDGVFDNGPAMRALIPSGGAIYFPAGRYLFNGSYAIIPGNTRIYGDGPGQTAFIIGTITGGTMDPTFRYMFLGKNYSIYGAWDTTPNASHPPYDKNITIQDVSFEVPLYLGAICRFRWAQDINILNVRCDTTLPIGTRTFSNAFAFLGCDRVLVDNFYARDVMQALDCWKGNTHFKFTNLWIEQMQDGGNGGAINWQGVGTSNDGEIGDELQIDNMTMYLHNGLGLFLDAFSAGSITRNMMITNARFTQLDGTVGYAIIARGLVDRLLVRGITVSAASGANISPILVGGFFDGTASKTGMNIVTTTSGSADVVVDYPCNSGVGNYIVIDGGGASTPLVGNGVSLLGYYKIKSVSGTSSGNTGQFYTITASTTANASGPINATTRVSAYLGAPTNCIIEDVVVDGCGYANTPLIDVTGHGHYVDGITVTQNYGISATPVYNCIVRIEADPANVNTKIPCFIGNVVGDAGTGSVPAQTYGNNYIQWAQGIPTPTGQTVTADIGADGGSVATTAFASRMLGRTTPTMPDVNTTFTSLQTGAFFINVIGTLTADRSVIFPVTGRQQVWAVRNGTGGGFRLGVAGVSGPTQWIAPGLTQLLWTDGGNMNTFPTQVTSLRVGGAERNSVIIAANATTTLPVTFTASHSGGLQFASNVGFNSATPLAKPTITGSRAGNAALADLLTKLASYGLITDGTAV